MPDEPKRELTLYIQSKKAITSFYRPPQSPAVLPPDSVAAAQSTMGHGAVQPDELNVPGEEVFFLSDDQARCATLVEDLAGKRGYKVNVVDVGKAGRIERLVTEHLRGVQKFPVVVDPSGRRLEGVEEITEEKLCALMPTELPGTRAYTYIKVRGGDLDRIRDALLRFNEVIELHLLTGDWDVFVVLSFPGGARKRQVLDFVTDQIRRIPEVLDTSTLVPEYTVTKFPT
jgi:DNA-binding Lrp family transcriptional regulator